MFALFTAAAALTTPAQLAELDSFIEREMRTGYIPGLSAAAVNATHVLWKNAYGLSDPEKGIKATTDTLFTHASVSKTVISFVVMRLYDQGLIELDVDASRYMGFDLINPNHPNRIVTMRQLLSHTSSIDDSIIERRFYDKLFVEGDYSGEIGDFLQSILTDTGKNYHDGDAWHRYAPGARFDYSNIGATTAAHAAEFVARQALQAGHDLGFPNKGAINKNPTFNDLAVAMFKQVWGEDKAAYFIRDLEGLDIAIPSTTQDGTPNSPWKDFCLYGYPDYPDGDFHATPVGYSKLLRTFMNFGATPPGSPMARALNKTTAAMMRNVTEGAGTTPGQEDNPQGIIWYYDSNLGKPLLGHNGGDDGVSTDAFFNPNTTIGFVVFTNGDDEVSDNYADSMAAIEMKIMSIFDTEGEWGEVEPSASGASKRAPAPAGQRSVRRKGVRASYFSKPCGLPEQM